MNKEFPTDLSKHPENPAGTITEIKNGVPVHYFPSAPKSETIKENIIIEPKES